MKMNLVLALLLSACGNSPSKMNVVGETDSGDMFETDMVIAQQFDVLQRSTHTQLTVGDIQDVVGLMIGKMSLQNLEGGINLLGKPKLHSHLMYPGNATEKYTPLPRTHLIESRPL